MKTNGISNMKKIKNKMIKFAKKSNIMNNKNYIDAHYIH